MTATLAPDPCPRELLRLQGISWIRYHDTNKSLFFFTERANAKAVNAMGVSERAAHNDNDNDSALGLEAAISHIHIRTKEHFWA